MLIVMHHTATNDDIDRIKQEISNQGYRPVPIPGAERTAIGVIGNTGWVDDAPFRGLRGILDLIHVTKPYKLVSRDFHPEDTVVMIGDTAIGGKCPLAIIAGPCAIESREQIFDAAARIKALGIRILRAGAFKPRTSPHSFQGMRAEGLKLLAEVRQELGIAIVSEVTSIDQLPLAVESIDAIQIGARNMQNFDLLREVGRINKPVILKRGMSATMEEWLAAAEHIAVGGNEKIVMCERGIRTFETATRNTADLSVIPLIRELSHLPVIFDPSHATGRRSLVAPMSRAAAAVGSHGLMIEVHPNPDKALSDGPQSLDIAQFKDLLDSLRQTVSYIF